MEGTQAELAGDESSPAHTLERIATGSVTEPCRDLKEYSCWGVALLPRNLPLGSLVSHLLVSASQLPLADVMFRGTEHCWGLRADSGMDSDPSSPYRQLWGASVQKGLWTWSLVLCDVSVL